MLVGFGSDMVEVKPNRKGKYYAKRWRPYVSEPVGPFDTWQEAMDAGKQIPKDPGQD